MKFERIEAPAALMGQPDGPHVEVPELGLEVPSFVNPREDLIGSRQRGFKRLFHHIPFNMRGPYKPQWLPPHFFAMYGHQYLTNHEGYVLCFGTTKDGSKCHKLAVNRSPYCQNHGGALHPADKKLSSQNLSIGKIEPERIEALDRVQRFIGGFLSIEELDDDEVLGGFVRNDDGRPIQSRLLAKRFQQDMTKELMNRMQRFMQMKLPNMLKVLADLAESDFVDPADRYKAATWLAERVIGKVPDVVFHGSTDQPYERMLTLASGSRDEHRRRVASERVEESPTVVDAIVVDEADDFEPDGDYGSNSVHNGNETASSGLSVSDRRQASNISDNDSASENTGSVDDDKADAPSAVQIAKEAREKLKRAKTRRFAARSQGIVTHGEPAWLIEYRPIRKKSQGFSGEIVGFKAILYPPERQTQAVLDKIMAANTHGQRVGV